MNNIAEEFVKAHGLDVSTADLEKLMKSFNASIDAGLSGRPSSIEMIPAYISTGKRVPSNKPAIIIDAGGTNLRIGVISFSETGDAKFEHFEKHAMPGIDREYTADEFFGTLAEYVKPLLPRAENIGFCFSYPAEITPDCDGRLIRWSKQIKAKEVEGKLVGAELARRLPGFKGRIVVLNDTVATLLAGVSAGEPRHCAGYVGFILGTGTNTATVLPNSAITKLPNLDQNGSMIVNFESGFFADVPQTDIDIRFAATTMDPGKYQFEKAISGGYLGGVGLTALKVAAEEGVFSESFAKSVLSWGEIPNKDLDVFCDNPHADVEPFASAQMTDDDRAAVQTIAGAVYRRAAEYSAVNIASAVIRGGYASGQLSPVCVNVDGSTFYRTCSVEFKSRVEARLRSILEPLGVSYRLVKVDDSPAIGAAVAALTI